ncbi:protein mono-ADP-ribosyltransferase PARP15-like isoform X2 [Xenopus laevis]|uniref:Poly [ADP-ribose] polymerase n=1 Tax=Xenopus laevis TaxID=8355 RepID=A0A8J1LX38_XENLA|nr:protein mono-ADP-ribosyltransferase PARP15-like isoform X2 [Xenopus laevis]
MHRVGTADTMSFAFLHYFRCFHLHLPNNQRKAIVMSQLVICDVPIQLKQGDITKEVGDAIVNVNNKTLNQNFGVCQAVLAAAGKSVVDECQRLVKKPHGDVVVTEAGNLKCKKIIHVINATQAAKIVASVKEALKECDQHKLETVSFPALGTGAASLDTLTSSDAIFTGIEQYLSESKESCVTQISIVVLTQEAYDQFLLFFQNKISSLQKSDCHLMLCGKYVELIKGDITDQTVVCIINVTNQTLDQSHGVSGAIFSKAGDTVKQECKQNGKLAPNGIAVTSSGNLKCKKIMHLVGPAMLTLIVPFLEQVLQECNKYSFRSIALPAIGTGIAKLDPKKSAEEILKGIRTYFEKVTVSSLLQVYIIAYSDDVFQSFSEVFKSQTPKTEENEEEDEEENKTENEEENETEDEEEYIFQYSSEEEETEDLSLNQMQLIDTPATWSDMTNKSHITVELKTDSDEHRTIEKDFLTSAGKSTTKVIKIERIQNIKLWRSYSVKRDYVLTLYPNQEIENDLYHGTTTETAKKISLHGFNRSFCGKNAVCYGKGTYFAKDASYSCQEQYAATDRDGYKHVFQAKVITGKWCLGRPAFVEPPSTSSDSDIMYDSVVNDVNNPAIYVIFCDDGAYPEYLITFKQ